MSNEIHGTANPIQAKIKEYKEKSEASNFFTAQFDSLSVLL